LNFNGLEFMNVFFVHSFVIRAVYFPGLLGFFQVVRGAFQDLEYAGGKKNK